MSGTIRSSSPCDRYASGPTLFLRRHKKKRVLCIVSKSLQAIAEDYHGSLIYGLFSFPVAAFFLWTCRQTLSALGDVCVNPAVNQKWVDSIKRPNETSTPTTNIRSFAIKRNIDEVVRYMTSIHEKCVMIGFAHILFHYNLSVCIYLFKCLLHKCLKIRNSTHDMCVTCTRGPRLLRDHWMTARVHSCYILRQQCSLRQMASEWDYGSVCAICIQWIRTKLTEIRTQ